MVDGVKSADIRMSMGTSRRAVNRRQVLSQSLAVHPFIMSAARARVTRLTTIPVCNLSSCIDPCQFLSPRRRHATPRMTTRRWMTVTASTALLCSATSGWPPDTTVSAAAGGLFAFGAMHHPWFFLAMAASLWAILARRSGGGVEDFLVGGYMLGWLWGAIAGMIIRRFRKSLAGPMNPV
jgi:hypothetical protein